jgi:hypothetical protein
MTRPRENRQGIKAKLKPEDREKLKTLVIGMGYRYWRRESAEPAWTEFLEAITTGDIILYKKVE